MATYVIRGERDGYERLQLLAALHRSGTLALLELVGIPPGARCVDVGCGGGHVTFELARLAGPHGHVTGIDIDEVKLELARAAACEHALSNVDFRAADAYGWDEPGAYDVVYSRYVLHHLDRPLELLDRMWAAVAPGGALIVEDVDFDGLFCEPPNEGFAFYARAYPRVLARRGADHAFGRKLYRHFLAGGIPDPEVRLTVLAEPAGGAKRLALATLDATADAIVAAGIASAEELRSALASLAAFVDDPSTTVGDPRRFQVWARRPAGP